MGRTYRIIDDRSAKWMNHSLQAEIHSFASNHSDMTCPRAGYVRQVSIFCLDFFLVYWGLRQATVYNGKGLLQWCLIIVICCIIVVKSSLSLPKRSGPGYYGSVFVHKLYLINSWIYLHLPSDPSVPRACPCCGCFHAAVSGWGQIPWAPDRPQRKLRWSPPSPRGRPTSPGHGRSCRTAVLRSSRHVGEMWQYMTIYDNNMTI